ncbi:MAG TPA: glycosyltransferase family A protein [Candidatus Binatia bacterium]|nr:glycosyltransferase family A protein [Candidatus Binatia bacterium]
MPTFTFTVFTPTRNRAHTLHRVHSSLCAQTFRHFEWIVVDDGSTDRTPELVLGWRRDADFPIRYLWQEHHGKHAAFNRAVEHARGELFVTIDSDDGCVPTALARLKHHWDAIPASERCAFAGVTALMMDQHGRRVGSRFPRDVTDSDSREIRYRYGVTGEKWGFVRTAVLREFPFPVRADMTFVPESIVWRAIATRFRTRYVNELLGIYFTDTGPASDQLRAVPPARKARGRALWLETTLNRDIAWFHRAPVRFVWFALNYARYSFHAGIVVSEQGRRLDNVLARALWALMLPFGFVKYRWLDEKASRRVP